MTLTIGTRPLLIAETFGPTVQGEGASLGRQAIFIRLSRCNLSCPGCDTPYTWDWDNYDIEKETTRRTGGELVEWALSHPTELVVISGGEPLIQQVLLEPVVMALAAAGRRVEIETNGTFAPTTAMRTAVAAFNVSPKLASFAAAKDEGKRIVGPALEALQATGKARFKFVVTGHDDLDAIAELQEKFGLGEVWVMPEGTKPDQIVAVMRQKNGDDVTLADAAIGRGWNVTTRLHVLLWGDIRGK